MLINVALVELVHTGIYDPLLENVFYEKLETLNTNNFIQH